MSPAGKSRLPTPASKSGGSPGAAAIGAQPRATPSSTSSLPSIRSFRKAFQFSSAASKNANVSNGVARQGSMATASSNPSMSTLSLSLVGDSVSRSTGGHLRTTEASSNYDYDNGRAPRPAYSVNTRRISLPMAPEALRPTSPAATSAAWPQSANEHSIGFGTPTHERQGSLIGQIATAGGAGSGDETLVPPHALFDPAARYGGTPPPSMPLPAVPQDSIEAPPSEADEAVQTSPNAPPQHDTYTFPYTITPDQPNLGSTGSDVSTQAAVEQVPESSRERQTSGPRPVLLDSPARSPTVEQTIDFDSISRKAIASPDAVSTLSSSWSQHSPSQDKHEPDYGNSVANLRHTASSPLSELVARLSMHSPEKMMRDGSSGQVGDTPAEHMDTVSLRGEDDGDTADGHVAMQSPFIPQGMLGDDATSVADDASVDGSSGISISAPSQSMDMLVAQPPIDNTHPKPVSGSSLPRQTDEAGKNASEDRTSTKTEKRWSMVEVEAAYARMRQLASSRKSSGATDAPSFVLSDDSKELETSFVRQLLENADIASDMDVSHTGTPRRKPSVPDSNADEAADSLTPLINEGRYSPMNSPHLSARSASPRHHAESPMQHRAVSPSRVEDNSPRSSSATSATRSNSHSGASASYTAPTTARSSREIVKTPTSATPKRRYSDRSEIRPSGLGIDTKRKMSEDVSIAPASSVGSDDTGWVTPKTSLGDALSRRRSLSPNLAAHRRSSSSTDHYDELPQRLPGAYRTRRPVSYSSATSTESGLHNRSAPLRQNGSTGRSSSSNFWIEETPRGIYRNRPTIPNDFRSNDRPLRSREPSNTGSAYSLDNSSTVSLADAKRADKLDLFLRCTKAEAAYNNLMTQHTIEKEALLDAVQEYKANALHQRQHSEALEDEVEMLRHDSSRKQWSAQIAEIVEARDTWQGRAQQAERELQSVRAAAIEKEHRADATILELKQQLIALQAQLAAARIAKSSPKVRSHEQAQTALPRSRYSSGSSPKVTTSSPISHLPRSGSGLPKLASGVPRPRNTSSSSGSAIFRHGRAESTATSSTLDTDFGDHLPPASDGWSASDSFDASLHLDEQTVRFLQDMDEVSVRSRQDSKRSIV